MAVQVIAGVILFESWTIVAAEEAAIPSDHKFVDELVSELGFQPSDLIERVRQLANMPSEAAIQHRMSYCVQGYADRIATDAKLREKVASEVEERTCAQLGLCQERGQQQIDQSSSAFDCVVEVERSRERVSRTCRAIAPISALRATGSAPAEAEPRPSHSEIPREWRAPGAFALT